MNRVHPIAALLLGLGAFAACSRPGPSAPADDHPPQDPSRIAVPEQVRQNLGIEFATVQRRSVTTTLRLPAHFELLPSARREYRSQVRGRVEVLVRPLQAVQPGDVLYRIDSPDWRELQRALVEQGLKIDVATARLGTLEPLLAAHREHEQSLREAVDLMAARIEGLQQARASVGGQAPELAMAQVQQAQMRASLTEAAERHAETEALRSELAAEVAAGGQRLALLFGDAAAMTGTTVQELGTADADGRARWRGLTLLEVRAVAAGLCDQLPVASGTFVEVGALVVASTDPQQLRLVAAAPQADLTRLRDGMSVQIVPAGTAGDTVSVPGRLQIGAEADPVQRTIGLSVWPDSVPPWARAHVAAFVEVVLARGEQPELCVPRAAVMQDGLQHVLFRRDGKNPDQVIRMVADLGRDDGRWIEVKSGLTDGDSIVVAGAYELMLASSGSSPKGGHFHADGSFHATDHK